MKTEEKQVEPSEKDIRQFGFNPVEMYQLRKVIREEIDRVFTITVENIKRPDAIK